MSSFCKAVVYLLLALPAVAHSQAFAKITIRPASSADPRNMRMQVLPNGDLIANAVPVIMLLSYAYDVPVDPSARLSPLPDWTIRERYDIEGKGTANTSSLQGSDSRSRIQQKIRGLLADRFRLAMRVENKTMSVYALTVASSGSKLRKSALTDKECAFDTDPQGCHNFVPGFGHPLNAKARLRPSPKRECHRYGRPCPLHCELDGPACREPHVAERALHRKHRRLVPDASTPSATERSTGCEPLRRPPHNFHGPQQTRPRIESSTGHLARIHRGAH